MLHTSISVLHIYNYIDLSFHDNFINQQSNRRRRDICDADSLSQILYWIGFRTEDQKVGILYKIIQNNDLDRVIQALKAQQTASTAITYTMTANHLSMAVSVDGSI